MTHEHTYHHQTSGISHSKSFALGIGLNIVFVAVEIFYGLIANSSALLADAGHNASDVLGLVFAWTAAWLATIKPKGKYTYGLRKTTILVSILNALLLFGAVVLIGWDAIGKFKTPEPVAGTQVIIVAAIGVIINTATALLFMKGQKDDLNIKGAFLHMAADAGVSLGVVVAGLLINLTGLRWIDPVTSFVIIVVILWGTWNLFSDSLELALDAVPKHIKIEVVRGFLESQEGVTNVHDLHIWAMSTTKVALTAHLVMPDVVGDNFINNLQHRLEHEFKISHSTFQVENAVMEENCKTDC
ncbi:cation diffusion facilitator family transporter [Maribellus maritimus]|uniref:cation diffusion facilitator family transporter n=1 Tax=Maribellus maritimus TaxID=2870838 RepID=UPI001EEAB647|nr:cation diffusion facilitator family transporter [Maribellus maritimus]MCG6189984.1 cation diffusion facilitator family transporter [Maribellus maritimus]